MQLVITNLPESHFEEVEAKVLPGRSEAGYKVRAHLDHANFFFFKRGTTMVPLKRCSEAGYKVHADFNPKWAL
jgi:hypothetical protein